MNPAFHRALPVKIFSGRMPIFFDLIDQDSDNVPIVARMRNFTLDALGLAAFGKNKNKHAHMNFFLIVFIRLRLSSNVWRSRGLDKKI